MVAMARKKSGKIELEIGARPNKDEIAVAEYCAQHFGWMILFLRESRVKGDHRPDFRANDIEWEIKTPTKAKENTLDHAMKHGLKQSENLIFDLRKMRNTGEKASRKLLREFDRTKAWRRIIIITRDEEVLTRGM
jgi:hypothetical protein